MNIKNIVLHIPHSSTEFPPIAKYNIWNGDVNVLNKKWCDTSTLKLFNTLHPNVELCYFPYSRLFCDVERLKNDPLETQGEGIVYSDFKGIKRAITDDIKNEIIEKYYDKHHEKLVSLIKNENTLLIDCHSFPRELSDVDLCIGYNKDWSKPCDELIDLIKEHFSGLKIGINEPYANSISPKRPFNYQSIMLEFNKKWYLNSNDEIMSSFYKNNHSLRELYKKILEHNEEDK